MLESAVIPHLREFATAHSLYLDSKGHRPARKGNKVSWKDSEGNIHDLDFVLEENGTADKIGTPVAFIETAWRRYTKHSRNKAQEIQGAILPLALKYRDVSPFKGVILAGVFTDGAINQMRSVGFTVLFFSYDSILKSFASSGIDASFDEHTADNQFERKIMAWCSLTAKQRSLISKTLISLNSEAVSRFMIALSQSVSSEVIMIRILPLHGKIYEESSIDGAIGFVRAYDERDVEQSFVKYEVEIIYGNGDKITGTFGSKESVIVFLTTYKTN